MPDNAKLVLCLTSCTNMPVSFLPTYLYICPLSRMFSWDVSVRCQLKWLLCELSPQMFLVLQGSHQQLFHYPLVPWQQLPEGLGQGHEWVSSLRRSHCLGHGTNKAWGCGRWRLSFFFFFFAEWFLAACLFLSSVFRAHPLPSAPLRLMSFLWSYHPAFPALPCLRNIL